MNPLPPTLVTTRLDTDADMVRRYAELTSDFNPIHLDADFAARSPFGGTIIHGAMTLGLVMKALELSFGDGVPAGELQLRFVRPVPVGATIVADGTLSPDGTTYAVSVCNGDGEAVLGGNFVLEPAA